MHFTFSEKLRDSLSSIKRIIYRILFLGNIRDFKEIYHCIFSRELGIFWAMPLRNLTAPFIMRTTLLCHKDDMAIDISPRAIGDTRRRAITLVTIH